MENKDKPAYPAIHQNSDGSIQHDVYQGLTKREEFARSAMQALITGYTTTFENQQPSIFLAGGDTRQKLGITITALAEMSVLIADETLKALDK